MRKYLVTLGGSSSLLSRILYSKSCLTCCLLFLIAAIIFLIPLVTRNYDSNFLGQHLDADVVSEAILNKTYIRLLLVTLFMATAPTLQLVLDSGKLFSKNKIDRIEMLGSYILIFSLVVPNLVLYLTLNNCETIADVTNRIKYLWFAMNKIQVGGILLGMLSQLFGEKINYTDHQEKRCSLFSLGFVIEKRVVNIFLIFPFAALFIFYSTENINDSFGLVGTSLMVLIGAIAFYTSLRVILILLYQASIDRHFRTHNHLSDFMYSFGLLAFLLLNIIFETLSATSHFSFEAFVRYIISTLCTEIFIMVIITVVPGVKNRRLAEIKHEQLEIRLNLIRYVSHEMRTPLNTVSMGVHVLQRLAVQASGLPQDMDQGEALLPRSSAISPNSDHRSANVAHLSHSLSKSSLNEALNENSFHTVLNNSFTVKASPSHARTQKAQLFKDIIETANEISESCEVAVSTLDDLLTFDKLDEQKLVIEVEEINPWKLLLDTAKPFSINASLKEIKFQVTLLEPNADFLKTECIQADPFKLAQVIRNLLSNAIKFTPEKGTVNVTMGIEESRERGRRVRFSVKDDGAGISAENMKKLFGQYVQFNAAQLQKGKGSGLGLWITKSIVELHGGRISAKSAGEGQGTEFYFDIPLRSSAKAKARANSVLPSALLNMTAITPKRVSTKSSGGNESITSTMTNSLTKPAESAKRKTSFFTFLSRLFVRRRDIKVHTSFDDSCSKDKDSRPGGNFLNYPVRFLSSTLLFSAATDDQIEDNQRAMSVHSFRVDDSADIEDGIFHFDEERGESRHNQSIEENHQTSEVMKLISLSTSNRDDADGTVRLEESKPCEDFTREWENGLEILIADDAGVNRRICKRALETEGHRVSEAVDGLDSLQVYEQARIGGREFDLILLDDNMPKLLGSETAKRLRDRGYAGVIIGVTGDVFEESIQRFKQYGANEVLAKPLNLQLLRQTYTLYATER